MFINICWTKDGETKKTLMAIEKATHMVQELENQGIKTWFEARKNYCLNTNLLNIYFFNTLTSLPKHSYIIN